MNDQVIIRTLKPDDANHGFRLSTQAGWNQTISEWNLILNDPASICLGAESDNQVVATAASMVLTDVRYRNRGISKNLLQTLLESIGDQREIKLDATPLGLGLYSQFGFVEEYKILRFIHSPVDPYMGKNENIRMVANQDYKYIIQSDKARFGADRSILFNWMELHSSGYTYLISDHNEITGFICGREGRNYIHLGPLMSTTITYALELVKYALSLHYTKPVIVDVPEYHIELIHWLESKGFSKQREFIRMYKNKKAGSASVSNQYFIAGPEFG
jgi:hypothetical protein